MHNVSIYQTITLFTLNIQFYLSIIPQYVRYNPRPTSQSFIVLYTHPQQFHLTLIYFYVNCMNIPSGKLSFMKGGIYTYFVHCYVSIGKTVPKNICQMNE